jgi:hypothetical protein
MGGLLAYGAGEEDGAEFFAQLGAVRPGGVPGDADRLAERHLAAGEREGNLEAVPALDLDFPAQLAGVGDDGEAGDLGQGDDAILDGVAWAARSIRGDGEVIAAAGPRGELQEGLGAAAAGGSADGLDAEVLQDAGEEGTVFAGADECGEAVVPVDGADHAFVDLHAKAEAIVPKGEDDRLIREAGGAATAVNAIPKRAGEEPHGLGGDPAEGALEAGRGVGNGESAAAFGAGWGRCRRGDNGEG